MGRIIADRVMESATTTGTGNFTLAGAVSGFQAFSAVCTTGDIVEYTIEAVDGSGVPTGAWEVGLGTYSAANTLTRTTVRASSNAGSLVTFGAGTKRVTLNHPAALLRLGQSVYFLPPKASDFTLSNSGCGNLTLTDDADLGLVFDAPSGYAAGGINTAYALFNAPGGSWTMTSRADGSQHATEYIGFGLCLQESSTGKFISFYHRRTYNANAYALAINRWTDGTTFGSDIYSMPQMGLTSPWRRIIYNSGASTYTYQISQNGKHWITVLSESSVAHMASGANKIGFMAGANLTTTLQQWTVDHFDIA